MARPRCVAARYEAMTIKPISRREIILQNVIIFMRRADRSTFAERGGDLADNYLS